MNRFLFKCKHCDHFVEENTQGENDTVVIVDETTIAVKFGGKGKPQILSRYIHLEDEDHDFDHDPEPGELSNNWDHRPDLFVEHADGRVGPNSDFHINQDGKKLVPWSQAFVFQKQKTEPVYLTSGCCEPAHANPTMFKELGLPFKYAVSSSGMPGYEAVVKGEEGWGYSYPLTEEEEKYIGEDSAGEFFIAYSFLFQGRKYLGPLIEVCWLEGRFSRASYGGDVCETRDEALEKAKRLSDALKAPVEAAGGFMMVLEDSEQDRHAVVAMFPPEVAAKYGSYDAWKGFLVNLSKTIKK